MTLLPQKIAIIGSGFLGLTLALRLAEQGNDVTVYESAAEIGGLASAWQIGDLIWDKHYHVTLLSDSYTKKIVEEIGLGDDFEWAETYAAQVSSKCKLYLQPEWEKAPVVTPLIIDYIKANPKWELSLQVHKYINVP